MTLFSGALPPFHARIYKNHLLLPIVFDLGCMPPRQPNSKKYALVLARQRTTIQIWRSFSCGVVDSWISPSIARTITSDMSLWYTYRLVGCLLLYGFLLPTSSQRSVRISWATVYLAHKCSCLLHITSLCMYTLKLIMVISLGWLFTLDAILKLWLIARWIIWIL